MKHNVAWRRYSRQGVVRVELVRIEGQVLISMRRISGDRPPAMLLGAILQEGLGPSWRPITRGGREVRVRLLRNGRVSVRCKGSRSTLRVTALNGVESFMLPADALAEMLGPRGLGMIYTVDAPPLEGWESVHRT